LRFTPVEPSQALGGPGDYAGCLTVLSSTRSLRRATFVEQTMNAITHTSRRIASTTMLALALAACATGPDAPAPGLARQIETARTPTDHLALAAHYEREAAAARNVAAAHEKMYKSYQASPYEKGAGSMRAHCQSLVRTYQSAATQYDAIAQDHRQMAQRAQP
jgi:hypothetical protein